MKNVRYVSTLPPTLCGIAEYTSQYVKALRRMGVDVDTVPITPGKALPFHYLSLALKSRGDRVLHAQFSFDFFGKVDLGGPLHLCGEYVPAYYWLVKSFNGPKMVTTMHELVDPEEYKKSRLYPFIKRYYRWLYRSVDRSDLVLFHTGRSRRVFESLAGPSDRHMVVPHACFFPVVDSLDREACKRRLKLEGKRVLLCFGFVGRHKGIEDVVEALAALPGDVVLLIAGGARSFDDQVYLLELKDRARRLGVLDRVTFYGYVKDEDVPTVMGASDLAVFAYRTSVQSGAVYYPMSYGVPVIAGRVGGFEEMGEAACIATYEPGDRRDMERKVLALISTPLLLADMRLRGQEYCWNVNVDKMCERLVTLYGELGGA